MKRNDVLLLVLLLLVAVTTGAGLRLYQVQNEVQHRWAVITQNNVLVERIDLNAVEEPWEFTLPGPHHEIIRVEKGRIRFKTADCPDGICVRTGWLENPGDMAVCLPNKAIINITSH